MSRVGRRALKAHLAAGAAALAALGTALADERLTAAEVTGTLGSAVVAWAAVYFTPNGAEADPGTSTPEPIGG